MTQTELANALREIFSTIIDGGDYRPIDRYFTPDFVDHSAIGDLQGSEAFTGMLEGFRAALPGFRHDVSDVRLIDDDTAVWQVHLTATFTGDFMGAPGNGQAVDVWVANAAKLATDGRIREHWSLADDSLALMLAQMGVEIGATSAAG